MKTNIINATRTPVIRILFFMYFPVLFPHIFTKNNPSRSFVCVSCFSLRSDDPTPLFYIIGFGLLMKKDIYNDFVTGAFDGLKTVVKIMPTLIGLMTGVGILRASGFLDALASLLENLLKPTGFPSALVPLSIVKCSPPAPPPVSSSTSTNNTAPTPPSA